MDHPVGCGDRVSGNGDSPLLSDGQGSPSICSPADGLRRPAGSGGHEGSSPTPCR
ncbi:hypothetical protein A2U01_0090190, partial [Trifolium medium]|nr:hypothetical protein [Trifolium medium]